MAGTAPGETAWLFVEYAGAWGRHAVSESRLPPEVRRSLAALAGVRVQLVRRPGRTSEERGVRLYTAALGGGPARVRTLLLDDVAELARMDPGELAAGGGAAFTEHTGPLWLVCTNGRRDRCCAELGRPVADALAARWPGATWETTHLGGHRFAATVLALPAGLVLGRLDPASAVEACGTLLDGRWPAGLVRGRAGHAPAAQVAEEHLRGRVGLDRLEDVRHLPATHDGEVRLAAAGRGWTVTVATGPGVPRPLSCGDATAKPVPVHTVTGLEPGPLQPPRP